MRLRDMLRKTIVSADEGEKLGRVDDVLLDRSCHHAVGLLVADGMLSRQYVVPFSEVQTVGRDTVIVRTSARTMRATDWLNEGHDTQRSATITGKMVLTADGAQRLGQFQAPGRSGDDAVPPAKLAGNLAGEPTDVAGDARSLFRKQREVGNHH